MNLRLYNTMVKDPVSGEMVPLSVLGGGSDEAVQAWLDEHPEALSQAVITDFNTLKTEVDTIITNNTKNLSGYEIRTYEGDTAANDNTYEEIIPSDAIVLQAAYQNYNTSTGTAIKTDNITYTLTDGPLSTQSTINLVITDSGDTRFTVYIICAIPRSSEETDVPELADIRIGADGTTYSSAGDAVRGQVGDLKNALDSVADGLEEYVIFDDITNNTGKRWASDGKTLVDSSATTATEFSCSVGEKYKLTGRFGFNSTYALYVLDANDTILQTVSSETGEVRTDYQLNINYATASKVRLTYITSSGLIVKKQNILSVVDYVDDAIDAVDDAIDAVDDKVGIGLYDKTSIPTTSPTSGAPVGNVGDTISVNTTTSWRYWIVDCTPNDLYMINTYLASNTQVTGYVYFTNANNVITDIKIQPTGTEGQSGDVMVKVPADSTKMYVKQYYPSRGYATIDKLTIVTLTDRVEELSEDVGEIPPFESVDFYKMLSVDFPTRTGCCVVNNQFWEFAQSEQDHSDTQPFYKASIDINSGMLRQVSTGTHNLGHVNSIEYNAVKDALVCGNGGDTANQEDGKIYIIENASSITDIDINSNVIVIDFPKATYGIRPNVIWGENNYGANDIIYAIMDDTHTIHKIQLGTGSNNLGSGTLLTVADGKFNGTFKIIDTKTWGTFNGIVDLDNVVQGATFFRNKIICGYGHLQGRTSLLMFEFKQTGLKAERYNSYYYDSTGTKKTYSPAGITHYDDYLFVLRAGGGCDLIKLY